MDMGLGVRRRSKQRVIVHATNVQPNRKQYLCGQYKQLTKLSSVEDQTQFTNPSFTYNVPNPDLRYCCNPSFTYKLIENLSKQNNLYI